MIQIGDIVRHGNFLYGIVVAINNDVVSVQWFGTDHRQRYYPSALIKVSQPLQ